VANPLPCDSLKKKSKRQACFVRLIGAALLGLTAPHFLKHWAVVLELSDQTCILIELRRNPETKICTAEYREYNEKEREQWEEKSYGFEENFIDSWHGDPDAPTYSETEMEDFKRIFDSKEQKYKVASKNCQRFARDVIYHFAPQVNRWDVIVRTGRCLNEVTSLKNERTFYRLYHILATYVQGVLIASFD